VTAVEIVADALALLDRPKDESETKPATTTEAADDYDPFGDA
jgi:hypothetical protein